MATSAELSVTLADKRQEHGAFLLALKDDSGGYDMSVEQVEQFNKRNDELTDLQKGYETALKVEKSAADLETAAAKALPQGRVVNDDDSVKDARPIDSKTALRKAWKSGVESQDSVLKAMAGGARGTARWSLPANLKTIVDLTTSYDTQPTQVGRAESAFFFGDVESFFPPGQVSSDSVVGYIQTTNTDSSAFKAENTAASESAFVWTPVTDEVEDVQAWIPISRNLLGDEPQLQSVISGMLAKQLQKTISDDILNGTGTTPVMWGVFIRSGFQTQAKGADPVFDACHKLLTKLRVTGDANPNIFFFHPNDAEGMRLTRTNDGIYIMGNPDQGSEFRLWGLPVVQSTGMTENTGGAVDTSYTTIFSNGGLTVEVSTEHSTFFTERKLALSLVRRIGIFHYRPSAAGTVTGI